MGYTVIVQTSLSARGAGGLYCYSTDFVVGALEQVGYTVIVQTSLSAHWSRWVILL